MNNNITLICTPLRFYTQHDEALLFAWLDKIKAIESYKGIGRALHIHIHQTALQDQDLLELLGVFARYNFDAKQLKIFMTKKNKAWFDDI